MGRITGIFLGAGALGVLALQQQAALPGYGGHFLALGLAGCVLARFARGRLPALALFLAFFAGFAAGFGWAEWRAERRLGEALSPAWEGRDLRLVGTVVSLPVLFEQGQRFEFLVEAVQTPGAELGIHVPRRLWLSRYAHSYRHGAAEEEEEGSGGQPLQVGERWEMTVRLKRPHGSINPGGFDYEAWLLERNLRATGYLRADPAPKRLNAWEWRGETVFGAPMQAVHRVRQTIRENFQRRLGDAPYGGILVALAIGDPQAVSSAQWAVFNRTGTTHLMSSSGLHVTLAAALVGWLVNRFWRWRPRLCRALPAQQATLLAAWLAAFAYALLAGFGIPAQRTCFMLGVAALALFFGRRTGSARILLLALAGVLLLDPWAVLAPGFWLSFGAVAALIWIGLHESRAGEREAAGAGEATPGQRGLRRLFHWGRAFVHTQWAATLATLPVLLWVFQQFPLSSPLANLIFIPAISFVITPLTLLAALLAWIPGLPLLDFTHWLLGGLMPILETLANWPLWRPPAPDLWAVCLAGVGVFVLLLPRDLPGRMAGTMLLLPLLFWPSPQILPGQLRATVLDVGQGQAVLLETARHRLLYDAGPLYGFGRDADDAGRRIVAPYLAYRGIAALDMLVLSHRDKDHAGGFASLEAALPIHRRVSSLVELPQGEWCVRGMVWVWDEVRFEFLHPAADAPPKGDNGDSCVLKVTTPAGRLLLTGDIDQRVERKLLATYAGAPAALSAEVLLMPHHGSNSSSALPFIAAVGPQWALASAGYRNRFHHPRPEVLQRYRALEAEVRRTDQDGALVLDFADSEIRLRAWRETAARYWHQKQDEE
ncbi:MAG: DNA internalization-related competence protein ComEC/Rec2 [Zoogloeaceae bacterium]|jgi:competence protein ComEC|nr:DNA internalization-related competence protein ComEC/Rec2 [Zoogloeaceae bacterium]